MLNHSKSVLTLCLGSLTLLSACATTDCDPSQGGYLRGLGCSASDAYGERQANQRAVIARERRQMAGLETDYLRTQRKQDRVRVERQAAERKYAALQTDLDGLSNRLTKARRRNTQLELEIANLRDQIELLAQDRYTPEGEKAQRLAELQRQKESLEAQVELALRR